MNSTSYADTMFTRARDYYLYSHSTRYVDLDLCRGRAPFGHKPHGLHLRVKQDLARGLWGTVHNRWAHRLLKAVHATFSECRCYAVYRTEYELSDTHDIIDVLDSTDLARYKKIHDTSRVIFRWYPFSNISFSTLTHELCSLAEKSNDIHTSKDPKILIMPVIPFPLFPSPVLLLALDSVVDMASYDTTLSYIHQNISPVFTAGMCYAMNLLLHHGMDVRPITKKLPNRSDLYSICAATQNKGLHKNVTLELPTHDWKQYGIYIRYPAITDMRVYHIMRELFFAHGLYIAATAGMLTLPPYFTAQELQQWYTVIEAVRVIKEIQ